MAAVQQKCPRCGKFRATVPVPSVAATGPGYVRLCLQCVCEVQLNSRFPVVSK